MSTFSIRLLTISFFYGYISLSILSTLFEVYNKRPTHAVDDSNLHFVSFRDKRGDLSSVIQGFHGGCSTGRAHGSIVPSEHVKAACRLHFCLRSGKHEYCGLSNSHGQLNSGGPSLLFFFFIAHAFPVSGVLSMCESWHIPRWQRYLLWCRVVIAILPGFSPIVKIAGQMTFNAIFAIPGRKNRLDYNFSLCFSQMWMIDTAFYFFLRLYSAKLEKKIK